MSPKIRSLTFLAIVFVLVGVTRDGTHRLIEAQGGPRLAPVAVFPTAFGVSPEVRDLPPMIVKPEDIDPAQAIKERPLRTLRSERPDAEASVDPVVQSVFPDPEVATLFGPAATFEGLSNKDNLDSFGFRVNPPDTAGDVGPNHYVQQANLLVRVWDKSGAPLTQPFRLSSLWAALGGQCAAADLGDPIVMYDPLADRWILSQFAFAGFPPAPPYYECVAVSKTPDPAGDYFLYAFVTPGANFPDYPKLAVWSDAYYMTTNQFPNGGPTFNGSGVFAFDRAKMLVGDPRATFVYFNLNLTDFPEGIGGMLPSDLDGMRPPPAGTPNVFSYFTAGEFGDPGDALRLFEFHVDFANPFNSTFTERPESPLAVAAFNPLTPEGRDDIEQPPPASLNAASLDSISDRLMYRLAYRNFGTHESLVLNHTVNAGTGTTIATHQAGIRYYELRRSSSGPFTVQEQATFAPDTDNRWMGSAAMDHQGSLAVGYSVSSRTTFPSIRYAGRLATDPPGGLFQGERTLVTGSGVQRDTGSRWGDYSAMSVDPADDCTFWYTNEYYTAASQASSIVGWLTRIGRFSFPTCTPARLGALAGVVTDAATGFPIPGAFATTTTGFARVSDTAGAYAMTLPPDAYTLTASAFGYLSATVDVTVAEDGTTFQNLALIPVPVVVSAGATLRKESCSLNGNLDPLERVTAAFTLQNIGHGATRNLVATLQPTGGVTSPSGPQSYGAIPARGSGADAFSFTASAPCGATVVATLRLSDRAARYGDGDHDDDDGDDDADDRERNRGKRDDDDHSGAQSGSPMGDIDLGTVSFTFRVGTPSPIATPQTFSSGNLNIPIPDDFTTVEVPLNVVEAGLIEDLNVRLRLNHTFIGDLRIELVGPDGTIVTLSAASSNGGDNFGAGANDCSGQPTVFDDAATASIGAGVAPFAGSFRPAQPLAAFNGHDGQGTWRLRITDSFPLDRGTLHCVQLEVSQHRFLCCTAAGTPLITADTAVLRRESFVPPNNAIDPGERVRVDFGLRNLGSRNTLDLEGTLQPTSGVSPPDSPRHYDELHVAGAPVSRSFSFTAAGQCGATVTPTLQLRDGRLNLGTVAYSMRLGATESATWPFDHLAPVTINDAPRVSGVARATPYPAVIEVSGLDGTIGKVTATLHGFAHTFPSDVDVLLVGPGGQMVVLLSDAGGGTSAFGTTVTFDDTAPTPVPRAIVSGTYRPTNLGANGDTFPAPAPAPAGPMAALSVFNGTGPNGVWRLFVVDDAGPDQGTLAGGWSLAITVERPLCTPPPPPGGDKPEGDAGGGGHGG